MKKTPMDSWIHSKIAPRGDGALTRQHIKQYQLEKLREILSYTRHKSIFFRQHLAGVGDQEVENLADFSRLPFTTPDDVRNHGMQMICTSLDDIERVVTLQTSGTTGESKRVFFTAEDLELTVDFFRHGMTTMVEPGGTVIIFLPGERPDSVGDLLSRALTDIGVNAVVWGPIRAAATARAEVMRHESPCLVGIPTQILSLVRGQGAETIPRGWVSSVLLSTDYVATAIKAELERFWACRVLSHYGLTETGLGGGVECQAGDGYHLREADLYTEIIDPTTGQLVEDDREGEVVFTTLTRQGMPLVRYRTGDLARMVSDPCPCGTVLKRLGRLQGRIDGRLRLQQGLSISMATLDESLFRIAGVLNFTAKVTASAGQDQLNLCLLVCEGQEERVARETVAVLLRSDPLASLFRQRALSIGSITFDAAEWFTTGTGKRQIIDCRQP